MWIFLNNAYLSIVDPNGAYGGGRGPSGDKLLVRGRFSGDIERTFPNAKVEVTPNRDYRFRALIDAATVADTIRNAIMNIDYLNFKGSTHEGWRHDAYMGCWTVMEREQRRQAQNTRNGNVEPGRRITDEFMPMRPRGGRKPS